MLTLTARNLELRGIANKQNKDGKTFYLINVEDDEGSPYQFYTGESSVFEQALKRGDKVAIDFEYRTFQRELSLKVLSVRKL